MTATNKLLLLDGHSMAFRAFHALPYDKFLTDTGQYTNAVHGFTSMLLTMIRQQKPTHVAVAFDLETPTFRSQEYAEYKAGRSATPEPFHGQVHLIQQVLKAMNIPTLTAEGYEADDVIASIARRAEEAGWDTVVVSGDRDTFQLISEKTSVLYPKKGISDIPPLDAQAVEEKYLVPPHQYPDLAALVGETADNLPGVPGVGAKTAAKWLHQYGSLDELLAQSDTIGGKVGQSLRENLETVRRNRHINQLITDLPLPIELTDMNLRAPDRARIEELFDALQFTVLRKRLFEAWEAHVQDQTEAESEGSGPGGSHVAQQSTPPHETLTEASDLASWLGPSSTPVGIALLGAPLPVTDPIGWDMRGIALSTLDRAAYIPMDGLEEGAETTLARWLAGPAPKVTHDVKALHKALHGRGLTLSGVVDDVSISAYLLQPQRRRYDLAELSELYLGTPIHRRVDKAVDQLDLGLEDDTSVSDAIESAYVSARLSSHFELLLRQRHTHRLLTELELPVAQVLAQMELAGIAVSRPELDDLISHFSATIEAAQAAAFKAIGREVNLGSPKQLQAVLFDELGMPKTKKIKTGYSTDADALAELLVRSPHPFLAHLQAFRDASKLCQSVEGLLKALGDDGRIHTTYAQNIAATGRLSSNNPNLQNIPIRTEEGRRIRGAFIVDAASYETLLTADYSQIEMRIMAHLSGDEALIQAFRAGEDLHQFVGSQVFGVPPQQVSAPMRSKVKAMSYGLVYGLSSFGLSRQLKITQEEARTLMEQYFTRFGAVRDYLQEVVERARVDGYTETIEGRRRYLPELTSENRQLRQMAERAALNAPIQGSAADIIKRAMIEVSEGLRAMGARSRLLLQVHDELVLEVAPGEREALTELVRSCMAGASQLRVPLEVHIGAGSTWDSAAH